MSNKEKILYIAFDTETCLMNINQVIPKLICMSVAQAHTIGPGEHSTSLMVPWGKDPDKIANSLINAMENFVTSQDNTPGYTSVHLIGMYVAFDMSVLSMRYPQLLPYWFKWMDEDRIHDIGLREKLMNLTRHGDIKMIFVNGIAKHCKYGLGELESQYLNIDRKEQKEAADSCRMTYYLMENKPLREWPENYKKYAIEDAVNTLDVFLCQETTRQRIIEEINCDPFVVETFRIRVDFALRLLECLGSYVDKERLLKIEEEITTEYMSDRLRTPLILNNLLRDAVPPKPHAKGTLNHKYGCLGHKEHPQYRKGHPIKDCGCPVKMSKGKKESYDMNRLQDYVLSVAKADERVQLIPSDACRKMLKNKDIWKVCTDADGFLHHKIIVQLTTRQIGDDPKERLTFSLDDNWQASYALLDPLLAIWAERGKLKKMMTDYLPKLFYEVEGVKTPAPIIHAGYDALKVTGRTSSFASKLYPSRNDQNVDPRIRSCTIPRPGNVLVSTDYSGMELGTLAQTCFNLFGRSVLRDKINAGIDVHAYLGAQIAFTLDVTFSEFIKSNHQEPSQQYIYDVFKQLKGSDIVCDSPMYLQLHQVLHPEATTVPTWGSFYGHYRKFAKPTDLGYPGGLGAKTFIAYAKGTYGVDVDLATAKSLKNVWATTFPEVPEYHEWINRGMIDYAHQGEVLYDEDGNPKNVKYYMYNTPRGMHRSRCTFCQAANGGALQAPSAEGATDALYYVQKAVWLAEPGTLLSGVFPLAFIHDEILWESPHDNLLGARAREIERIMIERMELVTPDVKAGAESAAMYRWNKQAESLWEGDTLNVWEPKE